MINYITDTDKLKFLIDTLTHYFLESKNLLG